MKIRKFEEIAKEARTRAGLAMFIGLDPGHYYETAVLCLALEMVSAVDEDTWLEAAEKRIKDHIQHTTEQFIKEKKID